jgi:hypothetical protein
MPSGLNALTFSSFPLGSTRANKLPVDAAPLWPAQKVYAGIRGQQPSGSALLQVRLWRVFNAKENWLKGELLTLANVDKYRRVCSQ